MLIVRESEAAQGFPISDETAVIVTVSPTSTVVAEAVRVRVAELANPTEADGPDERTPKPSEATSASASRFIDVFLDIFFLSEVGLRTIPKPA